MLDGRWSVGNLFGVLEGMCGWVNIACVYACVCCVCVDVCFVCVSVCLYVHDHKCMHTIPKSLIHTHNLTIMNSDIVLNWPSWGTSPLVDVLSGLHIYHGRPLNSVAMEIINHISITQLFMLPMVTR